MVELLETGGGVKKALPLLGPDPFLASTPIRYGSRDLGRICNAYVAWDPQRMDILLLLASSAASLGYEGTGDFVMDPEGRLRRRREREITPFVYAGVAMVKPDMFADTPDGAFSLNLLFDRAIAKGGSTACASMDGGCEYGAPDSIADAEDCLAASVR